MRKVQNFLNRVPNWLIYALGAVPIIWLFYLALINTLGPNPINVLERKYGLWALWLLIATLAITPVKSFGFNITKWRRPLGLLAFFYALAHILIWVVLDHGFDWMRIVAEIVKRPYITIGMVAFLMMLPLAITSNNRSLRKIGPIKWRNIHKLVYVIAVLVPLHFILVVKGFPLEALYYLVAVIALLVFRLRGHAKKSKKDNPRSGPQIAPVPHQSG